MARRWSFWMTPMEHRSLRWFDDLFRGLLMPIGQVLVWVIIAGCLLQVLDGTTARFGGAIPLLVLMIAFAMGAIFAGMIAGFPFRPKLRVTRRLAAAPTAGDVMRYRVLVENRGRNTARQIVVQERDLPAEVRPIGEPPMIASLAPGASEEVTLQLHCSARGVYRLARIQAASAFPSAVWKWPLQNGAPGQLIVYPRITPLERLSVPMGAQYQPGGIAAASRVGESTEFLGTRDWRVGDRLRDLHWPSFARVGRPIVKEFQEEYFVRVALVIDTEARNAREEALFERGLSYAAGAARALAREDAIIDLVAAGTEVYRFQAGRALGHLEQILEVLACLQIADEIDLGALEKTLLPEAAQLSAVMFIFVRWDEARARLVQAFRDRGVGVRVLTLRGEPAVDSLAPEERLVLP